MNSRERFLRWMTFDGINGVDRPPLWETIGYWPETLARWHAEGLPAEVGIERFYGFAYTAPRHEVLKLLDFLGLDHIETIPMDQGLIPQLETQVFCQSQDYVVMRDGQGVVKKTLLGGVSMPQFLEYPVKTRDDFRELTKRLVPEAPERLPSFWDELVREAPRGRDFPLGLFVRGFFGEPRELMGLERWLFMQYDDPGFVGEVLDFWLDFLIRLTSRVLREVSVDFACIWEDMCYHSGPFLSPDMFRRFLLPRYREFTSFLRANGVRLILVDCDGNLDRIVEMFLAGGVDGLYPLEVQAGNDPATLRGRYGRLAMLGGVDKRVLPEGAEAVRKELETRIRPAIARGGYIPSVDHAVPSNISLAQYQDYLAELRRILTER